MTKYDPVNKNGYKISYKDFFDLSFYNSEKTQIIIIEERGK